MLFLVVVVHFTDIDGYFSACYDRYKLKICVKGLFYFARRRLEIIIL